MLRSRLKNNFIRKRSDKKWNKYKKQINFCINFLRQINIKSKSEEHFNVINGKSISDNKKFWKTRLHFFSSKGLITNSLLLENNEIVRQSEKLTNINNCFTNITIFFKLKSNKIDPKMDLQLPSKIKKVFRGLYYQIYILNLVKNLKMSVHLMEILN